MKKRSGHTLLEVVISLALILILTSSVLLVGGDMVWFMGTQSIRQGLSLDASRALSEVP